MPIIFPMIAATAEGSTTLGSPMVIKCPPAAEEKVRGSLDTLTISSCFVKAQNPGSKSKLSSCQYIGASWRNLLNKS